MVMYAFRQKCGGCGNLVGKRSFHAIAKETTDQPKSTKVARNSQDEAKQNKRAYEEHMARKEDQAQNPAKAKARTSSASSSGP